MPDHTAVHGNRWLAPFRNTLLHPRLWHINRRSAAGGVAVGMFCGLIPGPFQMLGAAICAVVFRVNLPLALVTTLYTNPFTIVPLYLLAYALGRLFIDTDNSFIPPPEYASSLSEWLQQLLGWLGQLGLPLVIGVTLLASLFAVLGYFGVRVAWRIFLVRAWRHRRVRRAKATIPQ